MIRKARENDFKQIKNIHDLYILDVESLADPDYQAKTQKEGFTVNTGRTNLLSRIKNSQIFNVCEIENKIVAYIDINREIYFPEKADNIVWLDKKLKENYFHGTKSTTLHHIAVLPDYKGKGIAKKLLINAFRELRKNKFKHLFSIITIGPLKNLPSISLHTKMGFKKVCKTKPIDLFGIKNYESTLFYLKL